MALKVTKDQLGKLQTLFSQVAKREIGVENTREFRLAWASQLLQREVESFSDLKRGEAIHLIDQASAILGLEHKPHVFTGDARRAGTDGLRGDTRYRNNPAMVGAHEIAMIQSLTGQLGWDEQGLRYYLENSSRSPFHRRADKAIRTVADANHVISALRAMLRRKGLWQRDAAA